MTIHVVLTGSDRLEEHPLKMGGKGAEVSGKEKGLRRHALKNRQITERKKTKLETTSVG